MWGVVLFRTAMVLTNLFFWWTDAFYERPQMLLRGKQNLYCDLAHFSAQKSMEKPACAMKEALCKAR
jgi:hypothetical protein